MIQKLRLHLASTDALPLLSLLGIISGLMAGGVIILFRLVIETVQASFLENNDPENFEALSLSMRLFLPIVGALVIAVIWRVVFNNSIQVGVVHVLERLAYHQGHFPFKNFIAQFAGAALCMICGHSVGREGPGVHLGAAASSFMGEWLKLPNNCMRVLVACGAAASIAASFNTPIAGVVFAMEVIVMEYTISGFTPVILAAVSATVLTQLVFGSDPVFVVPALNLATIAELPVLILLGLLIGALAALFNHIMRNVTQLTRKWNFSLRLILAGVLTGVCAMGVPQIMGIGYDTVNSAMLGEIGLGLLLIICAVKLLVTAVGLALGLPAGLIGPTIVIGAAAGGAMGLAVDFISQANVSSAGFYAMLGMAAMMGAALQAPLAALMALLELTINTHVILPGMLVVIIAGLTSSHLFKQQGIFVMLLKERGFDYRQSPVAQSLRRIGVASAMNRSFTTAADWITRSEAKQLLQREPEWIVIKKEGEPMAIMRSGDLAKYLSVEQVEEFNLLEMPADRYDYVVINVRETLQQALDTMDARSVNIVVVAQSKDQPDSAIFGVLTRQVVESYYRYK